MCQKSTLLGLKNNHYPFVLMFYPAFCTHNIVRNFDTLILDGRYFVAKWPFSLQKVRVIKANCHILLMLFATNSISTKNETQNNKVVSAKHRCTKGKRMVLILRLKYRRREKP